MIARLGLRGLAGWLVWAPKTNFSNRRLRVPQMRNQTPWRASLALALSAASLAFAPTTGLAKDYVVHAGRLFDGLDKTIHKEMTLRIHDDRIVAVEPGYQPAPAGVEVIDLTQDLYHCARCRRSDRCGGGAEARRRPWRYTRPSLVGGG